MQLINILYLHAGAELYGADIILLQLLKGLDKNIFNPHVILPIDGPLVEELKSNGIKVSIMDYPILRRKYFNIRGIKEYLLGLKKSIKEIIEYCEENNIKLIHSNTAAVLEGAYISRKLKIKHLWHIHETLTKPKAVFLFLAYIISKNSDLVVTVSETTKKNWLDTKFFSNNQIRVIYNGVDNEKFNPYNDSAYIKRELGIHEKDIVVGMIGRVNAIKGQGDLILAMDKVFKENENVKLLLVGGVFAGEEWRMEKLREQVSVSPYSSRIIIEEFRKDNANMHCAFDTFVLPSTGLDSLPTVVLEAMASGKPIVAYEHGGVTEIVRDNYNGFFAKVCDTEDLGEKIQLLVKDKDLRLKMGRNSLEIQKEQFSLEKFILNFESTYTELTR